MITPLEIDERRGCTSASNAAADALCPGRHLAQRGLARVESEWSESGTKTHNALATGKREGLSVPELETVERCLEIERKKLREFFGDEADKATAYAEDPSNPGTSRLWVRFKGPDGKEYEHSCRPDKFYRINHRVLLIEYKTLMGDVPASPRNLQLRDQQVMVRGNLLVTGDIGVVVIQPWVEQDPPICVYTPEDSKRAQDEMFARIIASNQPGALRVAGEEQCRFCLAKTHCPAWQKWSGSLAPAMLTLLEVPIAQWSPEQRTRAAEALRPAQQLLDTIKEEIVAGLGKDPNFCPGYCLRPGNVTETITNPQEACNRFVKFGGKVEDFMAAVKISKTALKEQINSTTGAKGAALNKAMAMICEGIVAKKQNAPSLVRVKE